MQDDYHSPIPEQLRWRDWAANPEGMTGDALLSFVNNDLFPTLKELPGEPPRTARRLCGAHGVRGCLQLHEVRPADAAGHQQDQRRRFQQLRTIATSSAISTSRSCATCRAPATPASITRRVPSPHSWSTWSTRSWARFYLTRPAAPAAFSPAPSSTSASAMSRPRTTNRRCSRALRGCREEAAAALAVHHQHDAARHRRSRASSATTTRWRAPTSATARRIGSMSSSPTRPSAAWKKTASRPISRPTSAPEKRPICFWC